MQCDIKNLACQRFWQRLTVICCAFECRMHDAWWYATYTCTYTHTCTWQLPAAFDNKFREQNNIRRARQDLKDSDRERAIERGKTNAERDMEWKPQKSCLAENSECFSCCCCCCWHLLLLLSVSVCLLVSLHAAGEKNLMMLLQTHSWCCCRLLVCVSGSTHTYIHMRIL